MALRVYNTLSRTKEPFVPHEDRYVRMYVCGPNVYGPCHVGHAMSYIVFDVVRRYLEYRGYKVDHVQNFTDIEDRIIETARAEGTTVKALADKYIDRFLVEMAGLNVLRAHHYPRATGVIPKMIEIIEGLIVRGHAYAVDGDVYYRVQSYPDYGRLSGRSLEEMQAGVRIEVDARKEHPMDFALWKRARPDEPSWDSPWGEGRPGWHIECSAMVLQLLGEQVDIHGGGHDVIFPHHENEIAQSEAYTGKAPFVKYWLHNGLLRPDEDSEKMTRHLGNFVSVRQVLQDHGADPVRLAVLSSHYRSPLTWSDEGLRAAQRGVARLRSALRPARDGSTGADPGPLLEQVDASRKALVEAMDDDFNTAQALGHIFDLARAINQARDAGVSGEPFHSAQDAFRELTGVLGFRLDEPQGASLDVAPFVELLVVVRNELRAQKQWALADMIRTELTEMGVVLEDGVEATTWRLS